MKKRARLAFRVTDEIVDALDCAVLARGESRGSIITRALAVELGLIRPFLNFDSGEDNSGSPIDADKT